jgi:hypothetical protein
MGKATNEGPLLSEAGIFCKGYKKEAPVGLSFLDNTTDRCLHNG